MHPSDRILRLLLILGLCSVGCAHTPTSLPGPSTFVATESSPAIIDAYIANPPDILFVEMAPQPSDEQRIRIGENILIAVANALPDYPIQGTFKVEPDGSIDLGFYGKVKVGGNTVAEAKAIVREQVAKEVVDPLVEIQLPQLPPISGEYAIRPDGKIKLGFYGDVFVAGKTLDEIEADVRTFLKNEHEIADMKLAIDVSAYNSLTYYIITDGAGGGDQVTRIPFTGQETVLDAFSEIGGIPQFGSKANIWISRPIADDPNAAEILPIDWNAITKQGMTATNYQILPNDRIYVKADKLVVADTWISKIAAPIERITGLVTLFDITIESVSGNNQNNNNNNNNN